MLVLTRKKEESIIIDGNIEIQILDIVDNKIKLGIKAPKDVEIFRKEVYLEIQEENKNAANFSMALEGLEKILKK